MKSYEISRSKIGPFSFAYTGRGLENQSSEHQWAGYPEIHVHGGNNARQEMATALNFITKANGTVTKLKVLAPCMIHFLLPKDQAKDIILPCCCYILFQPLQTQPLSHKARGEFATVWTQDTPKPSHGQKTPPKS